MPKQKNEIPERANRLRSRKNTYVCKCSFTRALALMAVVLLLTACGANKTPQKNAADEAGYPADPIIRSPIQLQPRQIIVAFPDYGDVASEAFSQRIAKDHAVSLKVIWPLPSIDVDCAVFTVDEDADVDEVVNEINANGHVSVAVRNHRYRVLQSDYNDPYASYQNNLTTIGAELVHHWSTGKNIKVAVVDTGLDTQHPDITSRIVDTTNFVEDGNLSFQKDKHGTAVAGIIAAGANNGIGIFGVAPNAEIIAAKACWYPVDGEDGAVCSSWTIARAIDYAISAGAKIINLSLGGPPDALIESLLKRAYERGIITVAAAGDLDAKVPLFPASLPTTIAVVASDDAKTDRTSTWRESGLVLAAPGQEILTTTPGESYNFLSGSSLSTAHVTGAVALLLERRDIGPKNIINLLSNTARSAEAVADATGRPLLDVCAAMNRLELSDICS